MTETVGYIIYDQEGPMIASRMGRIGAREYKPILIGGPWSHCSLFKTYREAKNIVARTRRAQKEGDGVGYKGRGNYKSTYLSIVPIEIFISR